MPRDFKFYLEDILEAIRKIRAYTEGMDYTAFEGNDLVVDAVVRNLEIIGEASKKVPGEIRERAPSVDWRKVGGFRDVLAHEYFRVNKRIVWDIVENKLDELRTACESILESD